MHSFQVGEGSVSKFLASVLITVAVGGVVYFISQGGGPVDQQRPSAGAAYFLVAYNSNYLYSSSSLPGEVLSATSDQLVGVLERHLELMDNLGIKADYYFTGLAAEKVAEWSPATVQRLVSSRRGLNYHGANRPPNPTLVDLMGGENWENDLALARTYERDGIHPTTGENVGGIKAFRTVFGRDPFSTGRFFEATILAADKEMGARMGAGLQGNTGAPRDDAWFMGVLNRPTTLELGAAELVNSALNDQATSYLQEIRNRFDGIDRSKFNLVVLPIHDWDFYKYSSSDAEKIWSLYQQALTLAKEQGFQFVTAVDIYALVLNGPAPTLTQAQLLQAAENIVQTIDETRYLPEYLGAEDNYFTLAEVFEALATSLASYCQTGNLPATVTTHDLLGPTSYYTSSMISATLAADNILDAASAVSTSLTSQLPSHVNIDNQTVNPAEFIYILAQEYIALAGGTPASVTLKAVEILPASVTANQMANSLTKLQFWTYKPAIFVGGRS